MSISPIDPERATWLARRSRVVGGSEIAALFGAQPDYALSHYALWHVKAGIAPPPVISNTRTRWGLLLEEAIAAAVSEDRGWHVSKGGYVVADDAPGMGCTLDYVAEAADKPAPGCLELKNVDWIAHKRSWTEGEPPPHVLLQLQHQLGCTGYSWGAVACLVGGNDLRVYEYEARPKLIAQIKKRIAEFWLSIEENRPPVPDGSDAASAVLRAMYSELQAEEIDLSTDNDLPAACAQLLNAAAARKAAEKQETEAKNRIRDKLAGHARARASGFWISESITPAKPDRPAEPGEIIRGRQESRRLNIKEMTR